MGSILTAGTRQAKGGRNLTLSGTAPGRAEYGHTGQNRRHGKQDAADQHQVDHEGDLPGEFRGIGGAAGNARASEGTNRPEADDCDQQGEQHQADTSCVSENLAVRGGPGRTTLRNGEDRQHEQGLGSHKAGHEDLAGEDGQVFGKRHGIHGSGEGQRAQSALGDERDEMETPIKSLPRESEVVMSGLLPISGSPGKNAIPQGAVSYEAKAFGVKTGTRISDAWILCLGNVQDSHETVPMWISWR
jgi:hypothetical protein